MAQSPRSLVSAWAFVILVLSTTKIVVLAQDATIRSLDSDGEDARLDSQLEQLKEMLSSFSSRELQGVLAGSLPKLDLSGLSAGGLGGRAFPGFAARQAASSTADAVGGLFTNMPALGDVLGNTDLAQAIQNNLPNLASAMNDFDPSKLLQAFSEPGAAQKFFPPLSGQYEDLMRAANDGSAEAADVLALLSAIFNLVSSILYIVSGALGTGAASLSLIPASVAAVTAPITFALAGASYVNTAANALAEPDDESAFANKWSKALLRLADRLEGVNNGTLQSSLVGYRDQLTKAGSLLSLISNPTSSS